MAWYSAISTQLRGWGGALRRRVATWRPTASGMIRLGLLVIILGVLAEMSARWAPPFWPFVTKGEIFVDSPEVYTRQRLVNDRYAQDHWLRSKLAELDKDLQLVTSRQANVSRASFDLATQPDKDVGAKSATLDAGDRIQVIDKLATLHAIEAESSIRAVLRQAILENQLDDRHDLSGNSIYGFKFDTTIVTGRNTRGRAYTRIRARIDGPEQQGDLTGLTLTDYMLASRNLNAARPEISHAYAKFGHLYADWLNDVEMRLDRYADLLVGVRGEQPQPQLCRVDNPKFTFTRDRAEANIIWKVLETVLALPKSEIKGLTATPRGKTDATGNFVATGLQINLRLGDPWAKFYGVSVTLDRRCRPDFNVVPVEEAVYVQKKKPAPVAAVAVATASDLGPSRSALPVRPDAAPVAKDFPLFQFDLPLDFCTPSEGANARMMARCETDWVYPAVVRYYHELRTIEDFEALTPRFPLDKSPREFRDRLVREADAACPPARLTGTKPCEIHVILPTGLFNLIERLIQQDSYSYAVLPKGEVSGQLTSESNAGFLRGLMGLTNLELAMAEAESRSGTVASVLGFSDSRRAQDGSIDFGWIFDPAVAGGSMQKSQMALISVPAWEDEIEFEVTTGWLDRQGHELKADSFRLPVALPPDFEAFETIIFRRGNDTRRQPIVHMELVPQEERKLTMKACLENSVLIPGRRLWRSTTVTLGAHQASKITVLPNMDGIIATFRPFPPEVVSTLDADDALRVWTSEGMVRTDHEVTVEPC